MAKFSRPGESRWTKQWTPYGGIANVVARMVELERLEVVLEGVADDDATSDERGDVCAHLREFRRRRIDVSRQYTGHVRAIIGHFFVRATVRTIQRVTVFVQDAHLGEHALEAAVADADHFAIERHHLRL